MDLVAFRCAASAENEPAGVAEMRCDKLIQTILDDTNANTFRGWLTGDNNFRKTIDPQYKANRKDKPLPRFLNACREYLVVEWGAIVTDGNEADDELAIALAAAGSEAILCTLDKDLLQVPGKHYSWEIGGISVQGKQWVREATFREVGELEGLKSLYISALVGDRSDNIIGIDGIGPVRAGKIINDLGCEQEMFDACRELYNDDERFYRNMKLLYIQREPNDLYDPVKRCLIGQ